MIGASSCVSVQAESYREIIEHAGERAAQIKEDLQKLPADYTPSHPAAQAVLTRVRNEIQALQNAEALFGSELNAALGRMNSPSATELREFKAEIENSLARVKETSDEKLSPLKTGDRYLHLDKVNAYTRPMVEAHIRMGQLEPVLDILELFAAYTAASAEYLKLSHLEAQVDPKAIPSGEAHAFHLDWRTYQRLQELMEQSLYVTHSFFPEIPDFSFDQASGEKGQKDQIEPFIRYLGGVEKISPANGARIQRLIERFHGAQTTIEGYRIHYFPRLSRSEQMRHIGVSLFSVPGVEECITLSDPNNPDGADGGFASLQGVPCKVSRFKDRLLKFISYFQANGDISASALVMGFIADYRQGKYGADEKAWETLRSKLTEIEFRGLYQDTAERWKKAAGAMLSQPAKGEKNLKVLLEAQASGIEIFQYVQRVLWEQGIGLRQQMGHIVESGMTDDYTAEVTAAQAMRDGFYQRVESPLLERYKKGELFLGARADLKAQIDRAIGQAEAAKKASLSAGEVDRVTGDLLLQALEGKVVRFDASSQYCEVFTSDKLTDTDRKEQAPWILDTKRSHSDVPAFEESADGFQKLNWMYQVRYANAFTVQNKDLPDKMFSALAVQMSISAILPNIVQARRLAEGTGLKDLSDHTLGLPVIAPNGVMVELLDKKYQFPAFEAVKHGADISFRQMIKRWAQRKGKLVVDRDPKQTTPEEYSDRLEELFEEAYDSLVTQFRAEHRAETFSAALAIRDYEDRLLKLNRWTTPLESADFIDELLLVRGFKPEAIARFREANPGLKNVGLAQNVHFTDMMREASARYGHTPSWEEFQEYFLAAGKKWVGAHIWHELVTEGQVGPGRAFSKTDLAKIYDHEVNIYAGKRDQLEYAKNLLFYRFPALRLDDSWKSYDGSEAQYRAVMAKYVENATTQITKFIGFANMGDMDAQAAAILDDVMPNMPLLDLVLKFFPDQKGFVCTERVKRKLTDDFYEKTMRAAGYAAFACSIYGLAGVILPALGVVAVVPGANVVAAVGVVILFVCAGAASWRAYKKGQQFDNARSWALAAGAQLNFEDDVKNLDYIREAQKEYEAAWYLAAQEVTMFAISAIPGGRLAGKWAIGGGKYLAKIPFRIFSSQGRAAIAAPWLRMGVVSKWAHTTLTKRLVRGFLRPMKGKGPVKILTAEQLGASIDREILGALKDGVIEFPWSLIGYQWNGASRLVQLGFAGWGTYATVSTFMAMNESHRQATNHIFMSQAYADPQLFGDLLALVDSGQLTQEELMAIIAADNELSARYIEVLQKHIERLKGYVARQDAEGVANAKANMAGVKDQMVQELAALKAKVGKNHAGLLALERRVTETEQTLIQWNVK